MNVPDSSTRDNDSGGDTAVPTRLADRRGAAPSRPIAPFFIFALYAAVAMPILCVWLTNPGIEGFASANYLAMVQGKAKKPYVMRALTPAVIRGVASVIRPGIDPEAANRTFDRLLAILNNSSDNGFRKLSLWRFQQGYQAEYLAGILVLYAALVGFAFALRRLMLDLYDVTPRVALFAPAIGVACLPIMFRYYSYVYDFPLLFVMTLGLVALHRRNMPLFWTVFVVGLFVKETVVLFAFVFWLQYRNDTRRKKWMRAHLAGMAVVFVAVRAILSAIFRENSGAGVEFHLFDHNIFYLWTQNYGATVVVTIGVLALALFHRWKEKPVFLRHALAMAVPMLVLTAPLGFLDEFRDYYEIYPAGFLLVTQSFCAALEIPFQPKSAARSPEL
ncbi:hypothetical protein K8I61_02780 [bacterium]|nr:hypothetical protein [bacterium]